MLLAASISADTLETNDSATACTNNNYIMFPPLIQALKGTSWAKYLEMSRGYSKSKLNDEQRLEKINNYLKVLGTVPCCFLTQEKTSGCMCLRHLNMSDAGRNAMVTWVLYWTKLERATQQLIMMEKIRGAMILKQLKQTYNDSTPMYGLPYQTRDKLLIEKLDGKLLCRFGMMMFLKVGRKWWSTVAKSAKTGYIPIHGLVGKTNIRKKHFEERLVPHLEEFFDGTLIPLSDRLSQLEDSPEWSQMRCFKLFHHNQGYLVTHDEKGCQQITLRTDDAWIHRGKEVGVKLSWAKFCEFWREHYPNLKFNSKYRTSKRRAQKRLRISKDEADVSASVKDVVLP